MENNKSSAYQMYISEGLEMASKVCDPNGLTTDEVVEKYNDWSKEHKYDQQLTGDCYKGPLVAAQAVAAHFKDKTDVSILDVAAGTGLVAAQLKQLGFHQIDALDASEGMLKGAKGKDLYKNYFNDFFPPQVNIISKNIYDVLVCCGGFIDGHLKHDCLTEMVRYVKPGGIVVIVMREENLWTVPEYKDRLEPLMEQLETNRQWICLEKKRIPDFFFHYSGVSFVYEITKA